MYTIVGLKPAGFIIFYPVRATLGRVVLSLGGECKTLQAHFGGKTVLHPPKAVLFDPPKPSCLTFGLVWFSHPGSGPVWAWGGSVKVRTSLKSCVCCRMRFVIFIAIFSLRYRAQYLAVLTHVCYINPYIMLFSVAVQMPPFWALQSMRAHGFVHRISFYKALFYYKNI